MYHVKFKCDLELTKYPFDEQNCCMKLKLTSASTSLINWNSNVNVSYIGQKLLKEYAVGTVSKEIIVEDNYNVLKVIYTNRIRKYIVKFQTY